MKIERLHKTLETWTFPLTKFMNGIASLILFLMMLLTITDVFLRKVFSNSILGTVEVSEFMLVILIFFSLAHTEVLNGHVKVDLVLNRFSERVQSLIDMITQFVCFFISALITWSTLVYAEKMKASGEVTQDLWLPVYPFIYVVAIGCGVLSLTLLIKFLLALIRTMKS